jgi:hydrogenase maturation protease
MKTSNTDNRPIRVIGLGNALLRDEGVGIHAVHRLRDSGLLPPGVDCVDGGTGGFILLETLQDARRVVLIDATDDGQPPGTITRMAPRYASEYPPSMAAHDVGLRDLLETSELLGHAPETVLFTVSVKMPQALGTELSPEVAACLPRLAELIVSEVTGSHVTMDR